MTVRFAIWPWKPGQMSAWLQGNVVHRHFLRSKVNEHVSWYSWDFSSSAGFRNWVGNEDQLLVSHIHIYGQGTKISQEVVVLYIGVVSRLWVGTLTMHFARQTLPTNVPRRVWHFTDRDRTHRRQGHTRVNPGPENQPQNRSALFFHTYIIYFHLAGGFKHVFFSIIYGIILPIVIFQRGWKPPTSHSLWIHCLSSSLMLSQENPCMVIVKRYCQNQHVGYAKLKAHGKRRWPI